VTEHAPSARGVLGVWETRCCSVVERLDEVAGGGEARAAAVGPDWRWNRAGTGKEQSPINFELDLKEAQLPSIGWNLQDNSASVSATTKSDEAGREFYNGHTFEVEDVGSPTIVLDGITCVRRALPVRLSRVVILCPLSRLCR